VNEPLPTDIEELQQLLQAERQRHTAMVKARDEEIDRLSAIIKALQRHRFGTRSEQLDADQLQLALEDVEQTVSASEAAQEKSQPAASPRSGQRRKTNRGSLPEHLPREEVVVDVADKQCACCGGLKVCIGEDVSQRLDRVPAQFKVIVTRRPKYACRACQGEVAQAPAPERLIENGLPTEALVAQVLVAKYADHLPLYRQAQMWARHGVLIDRSTLADWVGCSAFVLTAVYERLLEVLRGSAKLFADETTVPVLDPGRGRTKKGQLWTYARDDRPWCGSDPPAVVYVYALDRKHARPGQHLAGFSGIQQVDGYGAYRELASAGAVQLAFCWAHYLESVFMLSDGRVEQSLRVTAADGTPDKFHPIRAIGGMRGGRVAASRALPRRARFQHASRTSRARRASSGGSWRGIDRSWRCWHGRGSLGSRSRRCPTGAARPRSCVAAHAA